MAQGWIRNTEYNTNDAVPGQTELFLCQPCSRQKNQKAADVFCSTCEEFQCTECSNIHTVYKYMANHVLVNARELKSKPIVFDMKGLDQCVQHKELLKFYCEDEDQLCCTSCAIVNHRACHRVVEIQTIAGKMSSTSSSLRTTLQEVKAKADSIVKHRQSSKKQLRLDIEEISNKISHMQDEVNKMFENLKYSVSRDAETYLSKTEAKLTKQQSTSETHVAEATRSMETIDSVYENGTPSQQFIVEHKLKGHVNELDTRVRETCQDLDIMTVSFDFVETLKIPPPAITCYFPGQLTLEYSIPDTLKSISQEHPFVKLEKITSIDLKQGRDNVKEPLYSGLDFLSDGRLVAMINNNNTCLILNAKLEKVSACLLSYTPQSVVAISEEEVAITSEAEKKLDFVNVSKSKGIYLNKTCKVRQQYDSVCMKDKQNLLAGTIDDTKPIRIVSFLGEEKTLNINFSNRKYPRDASACTYIRSMEKVVFTDRKENAVYIYDVETNTRVIVKNDQIKEPRGVAVGPSDNIFVCSQNTNSIVQITPLGRVLTSHKLDMEYPRTICICRRRSILAVTNACLGEKKLQLFKLN